jgi:hypothetical protein
MKAITRFYPGIQIAAAILGGLLLLAPDARAEEFRHDLITPNIEMWTIRQPNVQRHVTEYPQVRFRPGDVVTVIAGGCCQTGGWGDTWKRYVDPRGPNSQVLYHGLIDIPGATQGLLRIQNIAPQERAPGEWQGTLTISRNVDPQALYLRLGYEDDDYGDNGYWGRDPGTGNQAVGLPDAFVTLYIFHP